MEMRLGTTLFYRNFPNAKISSRENMTDDDMVPRHAFLMMPKGKRCLVELE
jgi:hypothetical protein